MPTSRPRHVITETEAVAQALDDAAKQWPEEREHRGRLIVRLVEEGHRALGQTSRNQAARRREAIARTSGVLTGLYGQNYLDKLRRDWPA
jgi:hypothetical protein